MDPKFDINNEDYILIDTLFLKKSDLLRAISWLDFVPENKLHEKDEEAKNSLIKIINYLTRNA